ncbi:GAP1-N2 domain-containing protein [Paenibacillus macerans]|uniref:GAP1-N2 domain-containing protein n=1 Tax=Paenibacillus macerans TaxID=44252 RepID=UPI000FD7E1A4|nr:glycosyltransferase [Paenibacillus macerans]MCY7558567.1 glycosyltransferase [Paenibacillus macerans]MEC0149404.1 glycosyltransferase [Paenibacillus macerans]
MKQASPAMIQQQIYTRERSGLFRGTEGFDTVAASDGLDSVFIKKQLHPFCVYDAPAELASRGEKEAAGYPPAIHLFHTDGGDTVLGRSIYQPVDFTGLRSAFLTHNYVIPAARRDEIVIDYSRYFEADYAEKYFQEIGRVLPELEHLPQRKRNPLLRQSGPSGLPAGELLDELKLDEKSFKQLLFAVMTAVGEGRKKVYVALDVPAEQITQYAAALLKVLFACLPFEQRRRFGFLTYAKEPQSRKHIHLQFVERGSLRPGDREIEKEYVFDLAAGRLPQDEVDDGRQPYLEFVWRAVGELESLEDFHRFADDMLAAKEPQSRGVLSAYHELCVFYQVEKGRWDLYENHKLTVLRGLLGYLEPADAPDSSLRLNDIFLAAFDREFDRIKQRNIPELAVVECFRDYYRLDGRNYGPKLVNYLIHAINNALTEGQTELAYGLYALAESQPELSKAFFGTVLKLDGLSDRLFEPYIRNKLAEAQGPKEVLNIVHSWAVAQPDLLRNASFQEYAVESLTDKLRKQQRLLSAVHMVLENIRKWERTPLSDSGMTMADSQLAELLSLAAKNLLLNDLEVDKLTQDQVVSAAFLGRADAFAGLQLEGRQRNHADMLQTLYEWFTRRESMEDIFQALSASDMKRVQQLGREWLQSGIELVQFGKIVLAFYQDADSGFADYDEVLEYLHQHAKDKETIYEFMLWSQGHPYFAGSKGLVPAYAAALLRYFDKYDRSAFKSKEYRTLYFEKAGAPLAKVFAEARLALSSPLKRFLAQNGKKVGATIIVLASGLVVTAGILFVMQQQGMLGPKTPVEANQPPAQAEKPEALVYADNVAGADATATETTSLVFLFPGAEQCTAFVPSALTIESSGGSAQQFTNLKYESNCTAESSGAGDLGTAGTTGPSGAAGGAGTDDAKSDDAAAGGNEGDTAKDTKENVKENGKENVQGNAEGNTKESKESVKKTAENQDSGQSADKKDDSTGGTNAADATKATNTTGAGNGTEGTKGTDAADAADATKTNDKTNTNDKANTSDKTSKTDKTAATGATNKTNNTETDPAGKTNKAGTDSAGASGTGQLNDASNPKSAKSIGAGGEGMKESAYPYRVAVSLGMKLDVPAGSLIKLGDQQFTVISREEAQSMMSPVESPVESPKQ